MCVWSWEWSQPSSESSAPDCGLTKCSRLCLVCCLLFAGTGQLELEGHHHPGQLGSDVSQQVRLWLNHPPGGSLLTETEHSDLFQNYSLPFQPPEAGGAHGLTCHVRTCRAPGGKTHRSAGASLHLSPSFTSQASSPGLQLQDHSPGCPLPCSLDPGRILLQQVLIRCPCWPSLQSEGSSS